MTVSPPPWQAGTAALAGENCPMIIGQLCQMRSGQYSYISIASWPHTLVCNHQCQRWTRQTTLVASRVTKNAHSFEQQGAKINRSKCLPGYALKRGSAAGHTGAWFALLKQTGSGYAVELSEVQLCTFDVVC